MALKEQINNDLKAALLGGNRFKCEVLRGVKAVILDEEVAQNKRETGLSDENIEQLIAREVKKRNETAGIFEQAGRPELASDERAQLAILTEYLPKQMTETDIKAVVLKTISELGVLNASGMGQVIGAVKKSLGNSADGAIIARLVKESLDSK